MPLDVKTVRHIAELAQIELTPEEETRIQRQLSVILDHIEQLNGVSTDGIEAMEQVLDAWDQGAAPDAKLRDDRAVSGLTLEQALAGAPARLADFFQVPRIVERGDRGESS